MSMKLNSRSHVLLTLGVLFTLGGTARLLPNNLATAEDVETHAPPAAPETVLETALPTHQESNAAHSNSADQVCFRADAAAAIAEDRTALEAQRETIQAETVALDLRALELDRQSQELRELQALLDTRWEEMQSVSNEDLQHLARMYGAMKSDEAASIFNQMDPGFAAGFLRLLPSEQAGLILAEMESRNAYVVSIQLANRNQDIRNAPAN